MLFDSDAYRNTWDGACRSCGMGNHVVDQHAPECPVTHGRNLAAGALAALEDKLALCGCPVNGCGDIHCHKCGQRVNVRCWNCRTPRGHGTCPNPIVKDSV